MLFVKDKETKRKVRFTNQEGDVVGTLYVDKSHELASRDSIEVEIHEGATLELS